MSFMNRLPFRQKFALVSSMALGCVLTCLPATAAVITVGNYILQPNTPNQKILINITGPEAVAGEDFFAQIGDGGVANNGTNTKPVFTQVDILTGTIFGASNTGATGDPGGTPKGSNSAHPLIWVDGTTTNSGTVSDTGLFATITVDTSGVSSGTYALLLKGIASNKGGPFDTALRFTGGGAVPLTITNGSIVIQTPEPTSLAIIGCAAVVALRRRRR